MAHQLRRNHVWNHPSWTEACVAAVHFRTSSYTTFLAIVDLPPRFANPIRFKCPSDASTASDFVHRSAILRRVSILTFTYFLRQLLLDPQVSCLHMAALTKSLPVTCTQRGSAVSMHLELGLDAPSTQQLLSCDSRGHAFDHRTLEITAVANTVSSIEARESGRRLPREETPSKV